MTTRRSIGGWFAAGAAAMVLAAGCARQSPAVGEWKGQVSGGGPLGAIAAQTGMGSASMSLKPDGTGFVKAGPTPERPVKWTEKDGKVVFSFADPNQKGAPENGDLVGTLADDGRTMSVDLGPLKVTFEKQTGK
jgi:hypothetical protein